MKLISTHVFFNKRLFEEIRVYHQPDKNAWRDNITSKNILHHLSIECGSFKLIYLSLSPDLIQYFFLLETFFS